MSQIIPANAIGAVPRTPPPASGMVIACAPLRVTASNALLVPVNVEGAGALPFVLDTAAATTGLTPETLAMLGYPADAGQAFRAAGAGGPMAARRLTLGPVRIGRARRRLLPSLVFPFPGYSRFIGEPVAGILGNDFLGRFDLNLDLPARELRLFPPDAYQGIPNQIALPFPMRRGRLIVVPGSIDGLDLDCLIDTGAAVSVLNWTAAKLLGRGPHSDQIVPSDRLRGADRRPVRTWRGVFDRFALGGLRVDAPTLHIAALPAFRRLGLRDGPAAIIGMDLLRPARLSVLYRRRLVLVDTESPG